MPNEHKEGKRLQVDKDKTTIILIIAFAAIITVAGLMVAKGFWSQASYLSKVASKKEEARDQLEANKKAVIELQKSYDTLVSQSPNLLGGNPTGTGERDGNNAQLILDALPNKYDFPALAASLEKILAGYSIESITGTDESLSQEDVATDGAVEIPFKAGVATSYDGLKTLISAFNRSIRPFNITTLSLTGTNTTMNVELDGKSYYQPNFGLQITKETVE